MSDSNCSLCLEAPGRELACTHRICDGCEALQLQDPQYTTCLVRVNCDGEAILYEDEPIPAAIVRITQAAADERKAKGPELDPAKVKTVSAQVSKALYDELIKDFKPAPGLYLAGRRNKQYLYFKASAVKVSYYEGAHRLWRIPLRCMDYTKYVAKGSDLYVVTGDRNNLSTIVTDSGAVEVRCTDPPKPRVFDRDLDIHFVVDDIAATHLPQDVLDGALRMAYPEHYTRVAEWEDRRSHRIKQMEANLEVLELHSSFIAAGHQSSLRELARKPPTPLTKSSRIDRIMIVKVTPHLSMVRFSGEEGALFCIGQRYGLPDAPMHDLGANPCWTVNGDCLSLRLVSGEWVAYNWRTLEPMKPLTRQYIADDYSRYVPAEGQFFIPGPGVAHVEGRDWSI